MDKKTKRWGWLPEMMPGVARRLAQLRDQHGAAHMQLCWQRGVVDRLPDWFFVREGAIAIGTPPTDPDQLKLCGWDITPTQALVVIKTPEVARGSH